MLTIQAWQWKNYQTMGSTHAKTMDSLNESALPLITKNQCLLMTAEQPSGIKVTYHKLAVCAFTKAHLQTNTYD